MDTKSYDIIIIGAGVAGLTAAIYATRANKSVLVLESQIPGGQIVQADDVRNWPGAVSISGAELSQNIYQQAKALGADFEFDAATALKVETPNSPAFFVKTSDRTFRASALVIATGSHDKPLDLKDPEKYLNRGLSYCATCDGALYRDRDVAVIGGGNTAFYDALYLAGLARKVYLIHRRDTFRADAALVQKAQKLQNLEFITNMLPYDIKGSLQVQQLILRPSKNATDAAPKSSLRTLDVAGIFVAIGRIPTTSLFQSLVKTDSAGYIIASEDGQTSQPGIFVAGDCRTKSVRQLVTAAADGATAATSAINYLNH